MAQKKRGLKPHYLLWGGFYIIMAIEKKTKKQKEELIDSIMLNAIIKCDEIGDTEGMLHYIYALKMWRKE